MTTMSYWWRAGSERVGGAFDGVGAARSVGAGGLAVPFDPLPAGCGCEGGRGAAAGAAGLAPDPADFFTSAGFSLPVARTAISAPTGAFWPSLTATCAKV